MPLCPSHLPSAPPFSDPPSSPSSSVDWVQNTATATAKWGDIGVWDVSGVKDFSRAFSTDRNEAGDFAGNGNSKAATFVGTHLAAWITTSVTTLSNTFRGAAEMNVNLGSWNVAKVTNLAATFYGASKFEGTGLASWVITKVAFFHQGADATIFNGATSLTSCNKREIADAWKSNSVFDATTYDTDWAVDTCTVRFE